MIAICLHVSQRRRDDYKKDISRRDDHNRIATLSNQASTMKSFLIITLAVLLVVVQVSGKSKNNNGNSGNANNGTAAKLSTALPAGVDVVTDATLPSTASTGKPSKGKGHHGKNRGRRAVREAVGFEESQN